jgi:hypothetical protein
VGTPDVESGAGSHWALAAWLPLTRLASVARAVAEATRRKETDRMAVQRLKEGTVWTLVLGVGLLGATLTAQFFFDEPQGVTGSADAAPSNEGPSAPAS